jgi:hypothetical protein
VDKNIIDAKKDCFYMVSTKVMATSDTESTSLYRRWGSALVNDKAKNAKKGLTLAQHLCMLKSHISMSPRGLPQRTMLRRSGINL